LVPGYLGEPFLRLGPGGAAVNTASPTAAAAGLLGHTPRESGTRWRLLSIRPTVAWHDVRVRELAPWLRRRRWSVPVLVDGRQVELSGAVWRVPAPAPWSWLAEGLPFAALAALLLIFRPAQLLETAATALGALAAVTMLVTMAGFALDPYASPGTWIEGGNEAALALAGFVFMARAAPQPRAICGGALGALAFTAGAIKVPVLLHGVVLSVLPRAAARTGVTLMIAAGAAATAVGLVLLFRMMEWDEELGSAPELSTHRQT
jgi:hypothetical protein